VEILELAKNGLAEKGAFDNNPNKIMMEMTKVLGDEIPFKMRMTIANYTMATFVSHFHTKIELEEDNLVPTNVITFVLAHSGSKKTSSVTNLQKTLQKGYDKIQDYRLTLERFRASETGTEPKKLNPLSNVLSTEAGMVQRLNEFKVEGLGLPSLFVDEISTELATSVDIIPNIKLISQLFDSGEMLSKVIKDRERQSDEVHGMGMCGLFIGSEHGMLEDEVVLKRFEDEFISKLARRCFFVYPDFIDEKKTANSLQAIIDAQEKAKKEQATHKKDINDLSKRIVERLIEEDVRNIKVNSEAMFLYQAYGIYCEEMSKLEEDEPVMLETKHRFWKTLKLAAVYAYFNEHKEITEKDYLEAIYCSELGKQDLAKFAYKANRKKYEILLDHYLEGNKELSVHDLVKRKIITKVQDLPNIIELANSKAGGEGYFEEKDGKIIWNVFEETKEIGISYVVTRNLQEVIDGGMTKKEAKQLIAAEDAVDGFKHKALQFSQLEQFLRNDVAFTPFEFKAGHRHKDNLMGGANFIMLDVDNTDMTDLECADMLADYNFIMARTSDAENPFKYRVLMPTDIKIDIDADSWLLFMKKIQDHMGFEIDILSKAQIFYGYKGRKTIVNTDGVNLEASELIKNLEKPKKPIKRATSRAVLNEMYKNRKKIIWYLYEAKHNEHNMAFNAMVHLFDAGFSYEDNIKIIDEAINEMPGEVRNGFIDGTIAKQRDKKYGK